METDEEKEEDEEEGVEEEGEGGGGSGAVSMVELLARHQADIHEKKVKVAQLAQQTVENTDKVTLLRFQMGLTTKGKERFFREENDGERNRV